MNILEKNYKEALVEFENKKNNLLNILKNSFKLNDEQIDDYCCIANIAHQIAIREPEAADEELYKYAYQTAQFQAYRTTVQVLTKMFNKQLYKHNTIKTIDEIELEELESTSIDLFIETIFEYIATKEFLTQLKMDYEVKYVAILEQEYSSFDVNHIILLQKEFKSDKDFDNIVYYNPEFKIGLGYYTKTINFYKLNKEEKELIKEKYNLSI